MAVIHISRDEAANDFDGLIARAGRGDEIIASRLILQHGIDFDPSIAAAAQRCSEKS